MLIWALSDGKAGHASQAWVLAEALAQTSGGRVAAKLTRRFSSRHLPAFVLRRKWIDPALLCGECFPPWPDLVVSCGSRASSAALAVKARTGAKAVCILRPAHRAGLYDAVVSPNHDRLRGDNVVSCCGALAPADLRENLARLEADGMFARQPGRKIALLLGGPNRAFSFGPRFAAELARKMGVAARTSGTRVLAVPSRRTPADVCMRLKRELAPDGYVWDGKGANPYWDAIAASHVVAVTGDSVSMLSEACSGGRPTYIFPLPLRRRGASSKFLRFHNELVGRGCARMFQGELDAWPARRLDETPGVLAGVHALLR